MKRYLPLLLLTLTVGCTAANNKPKAAATANRALPTVTPPPILALGQTGMVGLVRVTVSTVQATPTARTGTGRFLVVTLRAENPTQKPQPGVIAEVICADNMTGNTAGYVEAGNTYDNSVPLPPMRAAEGTLHVEVPASCPAPVRLRISAYADPSRTGPDWAVTLP